MVATLALQSTRLKFLVGDDCIIACNGLSASGLQLRLELQRGVAGPQTHLVVLPSGPRPIPNGFPVIC